jgi:hypothetical protein
MVARLAGLGYGLAEVKVVNATVLECWIWP